MKSLLVSGYFLFIWCMIPLVLTSTFTSCGKLEELLGGGEEDDKDYNPSDSYYNITTNDGAAPYFELETTSITLPAIRSEEGVEVKYKTNISDIYYTLEKYKNDLQTEGEKFPFYILDPPSYNFNNTIDENVFVQSLAYWTNHTNEKQTDNLLIYATDKDSLLATIPIEQEAGPSVSVTQAEATINSITLTLERQNNAAYCSVIISPDSIPLSQMINDIRYGYPGYPISENIYNLQEQPAITFSNLVEGTKYYIYLQGGTAPQNMCGISQYSVTTSMRGQEDALIMEYQLNTLNNNTVYLPFEGEVKGVIDWGDGTTETIEGNYSSTTLSHHYKEGTSSIVSVAFKGTAEILTTNSGTAKGEVLKASLLRITQWGSPELKKITLQGASALKQVASDTKGALTNVTNLDNCFNGCTSLTSLPEDLFAKATNVFSFNRTFQDCTSLTTLPQGLFANNTKVTSFDQTFYNCTSLTTLPKGLFANNTKVTSFNQTFYNCTSLSTLPQGLFDQNLYVENISQAFYNCNKLKQIPMTLFDSMRMLLNTVELFYGCTSLTGESPYTVIEGQKVHLYERQNYPINFLNINQHDQTFGNCTGLSDYNSMPEEWQ